VTTAAVLQAYVNVSGAATAEAELGALGKQVTSLGASGSASLGRFSGVAKAGFGIAAAAVVAFGVVAVKAASEHDVVLRELEHTISLMPALVGASTKAFTDQAHALQELTGYQDEEILKADTILARFKLTQQQIESAIPTVLDFARATGRDVPDAALAVGKALLGTMRALKDVGVKYKVTGDTVVDFNKILGLLQGKLNGTAAVFGTTLPGEIAVTKSNVKDLEEKIGRGLTPAVEGWAGALAHPTEALRGLGQVLHLGGLQFDIYGELWKKLPPTMRDAATAAGLTAEDLGKLTKAEFNNWQITGQLPAVFAAQAAAQAAAAAEADKAAHAYDDLTAHIRSFTGMTADAFRTWRISTRDALNAVQGDLATLAGQSHLTADDILKDFTKQLDAMRGYRGNWDTLLARGLPASLAKQIQDMGISGAGFVAALATANDTQFNKIIRKWKNSQTIAGDTANDVDKIGNAVLQLPDGKVIHVTIDVTSNAADAWKSLPPGIAGPSLGPRLQGPANAEGGVTRAASGLIARTPTLIAEGQYQTFTGRGSEMNIPLDSRGIGIMAQAFGMAMGKTQGGGGGGIYVDMRGSTFNGEADFRDKVRRATDAILRERLRL
jgi:hypothetical protein